MHEIIVFLALLSSLFIIALMFLFYSKAVKDHIISLIDDYGYLKSKIEIILSRIEKIDYQIQGKDKNG